MIFVILIIVQWIILSRILVGSNKIIQNVNTELVSNLRKNGKICLTNNNYIQAVQYYSAILQIVEGMNGEYYLEIRRRSALTLAECESKLGNLKKAIARYSEVINEAPTTLSIVNQSTSEENDSINFDNEISRSIGKALYKRGLSFKKMKMAYFALLDLEESLKYLPDDIEVYQEIANLEVLDEIKHIKLNKTESTYKEKYNDLIEEYQLKYPRISLNKKELYRLKSHNPIVTQSTQMNSLDSLLSNNNNMNNNDISNILKDMSNTLMNTNGLESNNLNPLGNIGNVLGSLGGIGNNKQDGILGMIPLLGTLAGLDSKTILNITDIIQAINKVYQKFKNVLQLLQKNKQIIIIMLTLFWIIRCFK